MTKIFNISQDSRNFSDNANLNKNATIISLKTLDTFVKYWFLTIQC